MKKLAILLILLLFLHPAFICLILMLTNDNNVPVGNHEDVYAQ